MKNNKGNQKRKSDLHKENMKRTLKGIAREIQEMFRKCTGREQSRATLK